MDGRRRRRGADHLLPAVVVHQPRALLQGEAAHLSRSSSSRRRSFCRASRSPTTSRSPSRSTTSSRCSAPGERRGPSSRSGRRSSSYLDFSTRMLLAFGGVFELPLFIAFLAIAGIVTPQQLLKFSRWAVLGAFVVGAVVTPGPRRLEPDRGERRAHRALLPVDRASRSSSPRRSPRSRETRRDAIRAARASCSRAPLRTCARRESCRPRRRAPGGRPSAPPRPFEAVPRPGRATAAPPCCVCRCPWPGP
jgi:hypothetical protein